MAHNALPGNAVMLLRTITAPTLPQTAERGSPLTTSEAKFVMFVGTEILAGDCMPSIEKTKENGQGRRRAADLAANRQAATAAQSNDVNQFTLYMSR